ncbi:MAG: histidine--tRNA ligase [Candidatus Woesearchaeota archaeon]|jgi:histidyl-tRNA synthetase|nr:histidine--tRNA ligase [Candidatus Woesearchaeota archaeon]
MVFKKPKGTVDYGPEECGIRDYLFNTFRGISRNYGYQEVETPAFEDMKLLTQKSGEEIKKQIFTLEKKGDEELGLRFDLTVPLVRMFIEKQKSMPKPVKWFYCSRMWRYEKPQQGRLREFYQMSIELYGSKEPMADAEVINLCIDFFQALGLTNKDFEVRINNRKLLQGLLQGLVNPNKITEVIRVIDKRAKISEDDYLAELKAIGVKDPKKLTKILDITLFEDLEKLDKDALATEGFNELKAIYPLLDKKFVKLSLSTARGLDYYSGTVFEFFDKKGTFRSLCGGGRYDDMIEQFGGEKGYVTGFSIGNATLTLLLQDRKKLPALDFSVDYYVAPIKGYEKQALKLVSQLRKNNSAEVDLSGRNLGNQFKYADAIKAKNVIVIGSDEVKSGKVKVKDMASGKEKVVDIRKL